MKDFMLTVQGQMGARDIEVRNAESMRDAIAVAERESGCRVDHGRSGILPKWDPAVIIDASTGEITVMHDRNADISMQIANAFKGKVSIPTGRAS